MIVEVNGFTISDEKNKLDLDMIFAFLSKSYWANHRSRALIEKSIQNSLCFGIYQGSKQIGFARVVTDDATMYWLADVFIDEQHQGQGLGKLFVETIVKSERLKNLMGALRTRDAHTLYEKFDFTKDDSWFMRRVPLLKPKNKS